MTNRGESPDLAKEICGIVKRVESEMSYAFSWEELANILGFARRKCEIAKKESSYISLLFEDELKSYLVRRRVNLLSLQNVECCLLGGVQSV